MKKQDEIKYRLNDVEWAYSRDGAVVIPYIWNRAMTKIKLLSNGQVYDIDTKGFGAGDYIPAVKGVLSHDIGYKTEDLHFTYTHGIIALCHANKAKKSKIMRKFEFRKNYAFMFLTPVEYSQVENDFDDSKYNANDICALGNDFSVVLRKEYNRELAVKNETEPSYMDF